MTPRSSNDFEEPRQDDRRRYGLAQDPYRRETVAMWLMQLLPEHDTANLRAWRIATVRWRAFSRKRAGRRIREPACREVARQ